MVCVWMRGIITHEILDSQMINLIGNKRQGT